MRRPASEIAVVTAHFGDTAWIRLLGARLRECLPGLRERNLYVIDQNRTANSAAAIRAALGDVHVLRYPPSEPHFAATGHDHAYALNLALCEPTEDCLILIDSDAHPTAPRAWPLLVELLGRNDAVLAAKSVEDGLSHPCFMLFGPELPRDQLAFDKHQTDNGSDTGRLIYQQLSDLGHRVELLAPEPAFDGIWGTFFLERTVYHHGSGSFEHSANPRLTAQWATWKRNEQFARKRVFAHRYELTRSEEVLLSLLRAADASRGRAATTLAKLRR
jgi:hypothetical protein